MEDTKPKWTSKTLWANGMALVASLGIAFQPDLADALSTENQAAIVGGIMAAVNIILRLVTTKGLS